GFQPSEQRNRFSDFFTQDLYNFILIIMYFSSFLFITTEVVVLFINLHHFTKLGLYYQNLGFLGGA
ncbi:hypothetical protein ACJX0J_025945, partial [Zea mays]